MPPPAGPADVGGTTARQTCIHAPNRGTGRRSGHQYPPNVHPRPQPRDRPTFGAPIPAKRASTPPTGGPADVRGTDTSQTCIHAPTSGPGRRSWPHYPPHVSPPHQPVPRTTYTGTAPPLAPPDKHNDIKMRKTGE